MTILSQEGWEKLQELINNPPKPTPFLKRIMQEVRRQEKEGNWRTMESAPTNGTRVLVYHKGKCRIAVHHHTDIYGTTWRCSSGALLEGVIRWMPLPEGPIL